jgi:hypothetical protein
MLQMHSNTWPSTHDATTLTQLAELNNDYVLQHNIK